MNTFFWLMAGGVLGWIGYSAIGLNETMGKMAAVILGAVGGVLGGKVIAPVFASATLVPGAFSASSLFFAVAASAALLAATHLAMARWWR